MKYLLIDKKQRIETKGKFAQATLRIMEELKLKNLDFDFCYLDDIEISFENSKLKIFANKKDILDYTHLLFRGHTLGQNSGYETKRLIADYIEEYNCSNQGKEISMLNQAAIQNLTFYNKIWMARICTKNEIPFFDSYYRLDGDYTMKRDFLQNYPLILKESTGENDLRKLGKEEKIKKNVYKIEKDSDYEQELLQEKNLRNFFIQEYSDAGEDFRFFVSRGNLIGGWKRKATKGFMTVSKGEYTLCNNPDPELAELAIRTAKAFKADFIATDFMYQKGKPYLQEISFHPGFKAYEEKATGDKPANIAKAIIESF